MVYLKTLIGAAMLSAASADFNEIVGGVEAATTSYPWMVSLQSGGRHFCGGSLIREDVVLTAAHCMGRSFTVVVKGSATKRTTGAFSSTVQRVYTHEAYSGSSQRNDIAIVHLNSKVPASIATPVAYDQTPTSTSAHAGDAVTVIGWGALREGGSSPANLQQVTVQGFTNAQCASGYPNQITADMFCAGVSGGGKDSCQGDSGGPLFKTVGGVQTQIGVVSWGRGCARSGLLGVYARVAYQNAWIQGKLDTIDGSTGGGGGDECRDDPQGWFDSDGSQYNCAWYAQGTRCAQYGNSYANQGKTANQACCACGGGTTAFASAVDTRTATAECACDGGSGPYDVCNLSVPGIGEKGACLIKFGGGMDSTPKCKANANQELKFSTNYQRWYVEGCVPSPKLVVDAGTDSNSVPLVGGPVTNGNENTPLDTTPTESDNTILIVGASVGVIGAALVVGMIVTVKSRKENDEFSEFKIDQPKV